MNTTYVVSSTVYNNSYRATLKSVFKVFKKKHPKTFKIALVTSVSVKRSVSRYEEIFKCVYFMKLIVVLKRSLQPKS